MFLNKPLFVKIFFFKLFVFSVFQVKAQAPQKRIDTTFNQLKEVVVTAIITDKKLKSVTENVQIISEKEITSNNGLQLAIILNKVPGVFMQNATLNTNRITIRGIGARSPFGTTSIRAYFGDIPLTDGNGISAIEDFELATIASIEIHKGPAATSFGVGLGGTIILKHKLLNLNQLGVFTESIYGSFGLTKNTTNFSFSNEKFTTNLVYSNTHSDGFRENNEYNRETVTGTATFKISEKNRLQFLGNYTNLKAYIPSSVNLETYTTNPKSAAFTWGSSQGYEDFESFLAGISWQHNFSEKLQLSSSVFTTGKQNYEPRPFNILKEQQNGFGLRSKIAKTSEKIKWGFGAEFFYDTNLYSTFENLYQDFPLGTGSIAGAELSNYKEFRNYINVFGEFAYYFNSKWEVNAGFNINKTNYKIDDLFNFGDENQSGNYGFNTMVSPKVGLLYKVNQAVTLKASIAHGFAPPTTEETLLPDGLINLDLQPEKGWNYELGANFSFLKNRLYGDVSVYNLKVTDLLVNRRAENDALFAINAGETNHFGVEGNLNYTILSSEKLTINGFTNFSIYNYKFSEFLDDEDDFSDNKLTGVPASVINTGVDFNTVLGFYGNVNFQHVGSMPANDENTVFSEAYELVNTKIGYQTILKKKLSINAFLGVNNVFDVKYVSQLQVNASSFGGNAPRYYYAGNPINYYGGVKIGYLFH